MNGMWTHSPVPNAPETMGLSASAAMMLPTAELERCYKFIADLWGFEAEALDVTEFVRITRGLQASAGEHGLPSLWSALTSYALRASA